MAKPNVMNKATRLAIEELQRRSRDESYLWNPVKWAEEVLGLTLWSKQKEILDSLVNNKKTAVKSCHSIGKTFISAVAACWWVSTRPNSMVRSTAPTSYQVHELLWEEIRKFHAQHALVGRITQKDEWKRELYGTEVQVGSGKKPSDTNVHSFHGVHRPDGVLVILDEGCGVPQALYTAADAISTGAGDRVLAVGNPDDPDTEFGNIFARSASVWNLITVSAYDTPLFTGEEVPEIVSRGLIQPEWVEERREEWGDDSARFKSKILAEFPDQSSDAFFSQKAIDTAYDTDIEVDFDLPITIGVDIGGEGNDKSAIYSNKSGKVRKERVWTSGDVVETVDHIFDVAKRVGAQEIRIDGGGFGAAVVQAVARDERALDYIIIKVMGSFAPKNKAAHRNARAEQYDELRAGMLKGIIDLDRNDEDLAKQLLAIKYFITDQSNIQIESKKDMRSRGSHSPDELDAVVYAVMDTSHMFDIQPAKEHVYEDPEDIVGALPDYLTAMQSPW